MMDMLCNLYIISVYHKLIVFIWALASSQNVHVCSLVLVLNLDGYYC